MILSTMRMFNRGKKYPCLAGMLLIITMAVIFPTKSLALDSPAYVIRDIAITTTGLTRPYAIEYIVSELRSGISFPTEELLLAFLQELYDRLSNTRTLDKVYIDHQLTWLNNDEIAVDVAIRSVDSWNLIVLPYPKYDDNSGFLLSARMRDYNFLGSQQTSRLDVDYEYNWETGHGTRVSLDLNYLFPVGSQLLLSSVKLETKYNPVDQLRVENYFGLGYPFYVRSLPWLLKYSQGTIYTEDPDDPNSLYGKSIGQFGGPLYLGLDVPQIGKLYYTPSLAVEARYSYRDPLSDDIRGTRLGFSQKLSMGTIGWKRNFRDGYMFTLSNTNYYNPISSRWSVLISPQIEGHWTFSIMGVSLRLALDYMLNDRLESPGKYIRGILNDAIGGNAGLFLNLDLRLYLFTIGTLFEGQGALFFDIGLVYDDREAPIITQDLHYTVGIEGMLFALFSRSFFLRASWGINIAGLARETETKGFGSALWQNRELFIGIGFHY